MTSVFEWYRASSYQNCISCCELTDNNSIISHNSILFHVFDFVTKHMITNSQVKQAEHTQKGLQKREERTKSSERKSTKLFHSFNFIYLFMVNVNHFPFYGCTLDVLVVMLRFCVHHTHIDRYFGYASEFRRRIETPNTISKYVIYVQLHFTYQMKLSIALNDILWNGIEMETNR